MHISWCDECCYNFSEIFIIFFFLDSLDEAKVACNKRPRKLPKYMANSSGGEYEKIEKSRKKAKENVLKLKKASSVQNSAYLLDKSKKRNLHQFAESSNDSAFYDESSDSQSVSLIFKCIV
jgi:hypothetical protein